MSITPVLIGHFQTQLSSTDITAKQGVIRITKPEELETEGKVHNISHSIRQKLQSTIDLKDHVIYLIYRNTKSSNCSLCLAGIEQKEQTFTLKFNKLGVPDGFDCEVDFLNWLVFRMGKDASPEHFQAIFNNQYLDVEKEPEFVDHLKKREDLSASLDKEIADFLVNQEETVLEYIFNKNVLTKTADKKMEEIKEIIYDWTINAMGGHEPIRVKHLRKEIKAPIENCIFLNWQLIHNRELGQETAFASLKYRVCGPLLK